MLAVAYAPDVVTLWDPLTNEMMYDIAGSVSHTPDGMTVGQVVVSWTCRAFLVFWALLCTLRHAGARKADLLPVIASEFCGRFLAASADLPRSFSASDTFWAECTRIER